jgi:hypothetical protein
VADLTVEQKVEKTKRYLELDGFIKAAAESVCTAQGYLAELKAEQAILKDELTSFWPKKNPGPKPKAQRKPRARKSRAYANDLNPAGANPEAAEIPGEEFDLKG